MIRYRHSAISLCLIIVVTCALVPLRARADDRTGSTVFRLPAAAFVPIGSVYSLGEVSINGRRAYGQEMIWGGELLQVADGATACVMLDSIGRVVLERGTTLRLAAIQRCVGCEAGGPILIVSLTSGSISVQLQELASMHLEAGGGVFTATNGAYLHVRVRGSEADIEVSRGAVETEPHNQDVEFIVEPVIDNALTGRAIKPASSTRRVAQSKPGKIPQQERIAVKVSKRDKKTKETTPVGPGRAVAMALLTPGVGEIGSQTITVFTNDYGVAAATFTAGPNPGQTAIRATDENSGAKWEGIIVVAKLPGFWRTQNKILVSAALAATIIIIVDRTRNKGPLQQEGPPMIP